MCWHAHRLLKLTAAIDPSSLYKYVKFEAAEIIIITRAMKDAKYHKGIFRAQLANSKQIFTISSAPWYQVSVNTLMVNLKKQMWMKVCWKSFVCHHWCTWAVSWLTWDLVAFTVLTSVVCVGASRWTYRYIMRWLSEILKCKPANSSSEQQSVSFLKMSHMTGGRLQKASKQKWQLNEISREIMSPIG